MIYFETGSTDPYYNLAFEEFIFTRMPREQTYFMLWQNDKTVVVGRYQNTVQEINQRFVEENGIRVVRRLSGGGAVYHDMGNLNFTFITDSPQGNAHNFELFLQPVIYALRELGVPAEANSRNDITVNGRKISGNAQHISDGRILHHGTLLVDPDMEMLTRALRVNPEKFVSKGICSVRSRVTKIVSWLEKEVTAAEFGIQLREKLFASGELVNGMLSKEQLNEVRRLRNEKYATWQWNYGNSPQFQVSKGRRFPGGQVTVCMRVKEGCIQEIRFYGDFFGNSNLQELEQSLVGCSLNGELAERLAGVQHYISGISAMEIYELMIC